MVKSKYNHPQKNQQKKLQLNDVLKYLEKYVMKMH